MKYIPVLVSMIKTIASFWHVIKKETNDYSITKKDLQEELFNNLDKRDIKEIEDLILMNKIHTINEKHRFKIIQSGGLIADILGRLDSLQYAYVTENEESYKDIARGLAILMNEKKNWLITDLQMNTVFKDIWNDGGS